MTKSTMILPFSIQSKFQDYFGGIVRDFLYFATYTLKIFSKYIK